MTASSGAGATSGPGFQEKSKASGIARRQRAAYECMEIDHGTVNVLLLLPRAV
jgi:hypothetical protein